MRTDQGVGTLAARLRSSPMSRAELEQLARDLLEMLSSLHAEGTLHRDLNPASIRLDSAGRLHSSRIGPQRGSASPAAGPDAAAGGFVAPEVLAGGEADVAADLFACGVLLAAAAGPDAPAPVLVLIGMLTAPEPDLRPASAGEALALLGAAPAPPAPPAPRAPAAGYRPTFEKPAVPFPPLTTHAAAVDTPPVVAAAYPPLVHPPVPAVPYRHRRFGGRAALATAGAVLGVAVVLGGAVAFTAGSPETKVLPPAAASLDQRLDDLDGVIDTLGG